MDLAAICEVLKATQAPDDTARKAAEQKLEEAKTNSPDQLVQALAAVLAASGNVAVELRQEAAVLLRQRVSADWDGLSMDTCKALRTQILMSVEQDPSPQVQRNAGSVVAKIVEESCPEDLNQLMQSWPELLPWLAQATGGGNCSASTRVVALTVLKELVPNIGAEMIEKGDQVKDMLSKALSDSTAEVRAAGAQLVLAFIQHLDEDVHRQMAEAMPVVIGVLQALSTSSTEKELAETLTAFVGAIEAEGGFFYETGFEALWTTLMTICKADAATFGNSEIRQLAMECVMSMAEANSDEESFKQYLEGIIEVNFMYMLEVEQDVAVWTAEGKENEFDGECDEDVVRIGEENFDRLGTSFDEEDLMPIVFKVIAAATQSGEWRTVRSAIMVVSQIFEHLEDEAQVDLCVDYVMRHFNNEHPRVRYTAFSAIAQSSFDQSDRIQEKYAADLIPYMIKGMKDDNIRVATSAVEAFSAIGEDLDGDDLEEYMEELLTLLFKHLDAGKSRYLQETCIDAIAAAAQAAEELFGQYYPQVMPLLKQILAAATSEEQRNLRGKAFLCASVVGTVVGKEPFLKDACEIMDVMMPMFQAGFAADDTTREFAHEAAGNIAEILGKDFKGYISVLLPSVIAVLKQQPKDITELVDEDGCLEDIILNDLGGLGLKTSVLKEMDDALELVIILVKSLEEEFSDFVAPTCQCLMPMLDYPLSEDVRETVYKLWGVLTSSAQNGVKHGKLDPTVLRELVAEFLKKSIGYMGQETPEDIVENNLSTCAKMYTLAVGSSDVIQKAGPAVLTKDAMTDVSRVVGTLLAKIEVNKDAAPQGKKSKKQKDPENIDDDDEDLNDDDEDDDDEKTPQQVRFALVDIMVALMKTNTVEFATEVLPTFMGQLVNKLVQPSCSDADRALGFYIADCVTESMGQASVQYWQLFMNHALLAVLDKSPLVQQYATKVIGHGARYKEYSIMALAACQNVYQVLQKNGEKHKRRRVKANQKPVGLAIDACVRALGLICEHQEATLGQHAPRVWTMWIGSLPIKYDHEAGQQMHEQLLGLLAREHPAIVDQATLPIVLRVLTDIYKTKFSTKDLDKNIAFAFAQMGPEKLEVLCSGFKDAQKKKTEQMLKSAKAASGA
jgi:hypothetical protein